MAQDLIAGRYRVERAVGRGGMGTVWLCHDELLHRAVAVKQLDVVAGESADDTRRALREARTAAALNHRNAVSIYDVVDHQGAPWLVMEYVPSRTLGELMKTGPLPAGRVAKIGAQVAAALAAAHQVGITHRDVKPGNILVGEDDLAKISDFGIARVAHDEQLTQTGILTGTPAYFSPELARGADPSAESDVWALGATLYAAVEGHPPFPRQANVIATLAVIASEPVPRPLRAGVLLEPIGHMMDPDPDSRWTMVEAEDALRRLAAKSGTATVPAAQPMPREDPTPAPVVKHPSTTPTPTPVPSPPAPATFGSVAASAPRATPTEAPAPDDRRSRFFPVAVVVAALVLVGIVAVVLINLIDPEDPGATAEDQVSESSSESAEESPAGEESPADGDGTEESPATEQSPSTEDPPAETETPDATTTPEPEETTLSSAPATGSAAAKVQTIQTYFATVPDDLDAGWAMLAPPMQQRVGRDSYLGFWSTISDVSATNVVAGRGNTVSATVSYTTTAGGTSVEQQTFVLERAGAGYLIAADR